MDQESNKITRWPKTSGLGAGEKKHEQRRGNDQT